MCKTFERIVVQRSEDGRQLRINFYTDGSVKVEIYNESDDPDMETEDISNQEVSLTTQEVCTLEKELWTALHVGF